MGKIMKALQYMAVFVCWAASAYCNFTFGMKQSLILGLVLVVSDIIKSSCLPWMSIHLKRKNYLAVLACLSLFAMGTLVSVLSAVGFYSDMKDSSISGSEATKAGYEQAVKREADLKEELSQFGTLRPIGSIQADIQAAKTQKRWATTEGCIPEKITAGLSRDFCGAYARNVGELETARQAASVKDKLEKQKAVVLGFDLHDVKKSSDAQAEMLASLTGVSMDKAVFGLAVVFSVLLELVSGCGFWLIASARDPEKEKLERELAIEKQNAKAEKAKANTAKSEKAEVLKQAKDMNGIERFLNASVETAEDEHCPAGDLYGAYEQFCIHHRVIEPLNKVTFSRAMSKRGMKSVKLPSSHDKTRPHVYMGIVLRPPGGNILPFPG